jgi:NNP family nitrate/nitrite transporter-like MFS transporter
LDGGLNQPDSQNAAPTAERVSFKNRFNVIALLAVTFLFNFLARFVWGPLLPAIENDLGISHTAAGSLFIYITIGYFIGVFVSGYCSFKFNHQKTIVISSFACSLALIAATFASSLIVLKGLLILIGTTAGLYLPSGIASMTYGLKTREFGKAFAVHEIAPSLGFILGPLLAEIVLRWDTWQSALWPIALCLITVGALYSRRNYTDDYRGEPQTLGNMQRVFATPAFWFMLILFMLCIGANVGVYSMLPLYLQAERGLDQTFSNLILSASRFASMLVPVFSGWMTARYGPRRVMAVTLLLTGIATIFLGLTPNRWLWLPLVLQPVLVSSFFPSGWAMLAAMVSSGFRNLIVALMMPMAMLVGGGLLPTVIGAFGDAHMFYAGFVLLGTIVAASTVLIVLIKAPENDPA